MIIIRKKRLGLILSLILISVFSFSIAKERTNKTIVNESVATVALPVSNKVIIVDAGHGVPDEGAQSSNRNNRSTNKFKDST